MLLTGEVYAGLGGDYNRKRDPERITKRITKRLIAQLEVLGQQVILEELPQAADPTATALGRGIFGQRTKASNPVLRVLWR